MKRVENRPEVDRNDSDTEAAELATIPFAAHVAASSESQAVDEVLASGSLGSDGPFTARAAAQIASHLDGAPVLLTASGTDALELAALLVGVAPGDEVVLPSYTHPSTANAFVLRGATLRFADVDADTFSMEAADLAAACTAKTRWVVAVPYGGVQRDASDLALACDQRGIGLIEDAAHGLFACSDGRPIGTIGAVAALSFHSTKNISCGEGGALVVNDPALLSHAHVLRDKGTDRQRFLAGRVDKYRWQAAGSSFAIGELGAAVLSAQLADHEAIQHARQAAWSAYREILEPESERLDIRLQHAPETVAHPAHAFVLLIPEHARRDEVLGMLERAGVHAVTHFEPLDSSPFGQHLEANSLASVGGHGLPVTEQLGRRLIRLPLHRGVSPEHATRIARRVVKVLQALEPRQRATVAGVREAPTTVIASREFAGGSVGADAEPRTLPSSWERIERGTPMEFVAALRAEAATHVAVHHPLLERLARGQLPDVVGALRDLARQYTVYTDRFVDYLGAVVDALPAGSDRGNLVENLAEEAGNPKSDDPAKRPHRDLYADYCRAIGVTDVFAAEHPPSSTVRMWQAQFLDLCRQSAAVGVGAIGLGTELIVPAIYAKVLRALENYTDLSRRDQLFFRIHASADIAHAEDLCELAIELASGPEAREQLRFGMLTALHLRRVFWDTQLSRACRMPRVRRSIVAVNPHGHRSALR